MDDIYNQYCPHGNPIYYPLCPGCMADRKKRDEVRYNKYWKNAKINFMRYFNDNFSFTDPSLQSPNVVKIRKDDKFYKLKKSKSQEELKKNYFSLAKKYHPDKPTGDTKLMQKLQQIYELLSRQFN